MNCAARKKSRKSPRSCDLDKSVRVAIYISMKMLLTIFALLFMNAAPAYADKAAIYTSWKDNLNPLKAKKSSATFIKARNGALIRAEISSFSKPIRLPLCRNMAGIVHGLLPKENWLRALLNIGVLKTGSFILILMPA